MFEAESGLGRFNDPWGDLINYFRELSVTRIRFQLLIEAATGLGRAA